MDLLISLDPLRRLITSSMLVAATVPNPQAVPEEFPQRTVHLVIPFTAGGTTDIIARVIADKLNTRLGQPVVVDNRPGAATMIAAEQVAKAPADGYTLLLASSTTFSMLPALRTGLPIPAQGAWAPIGIIAEAPVMLSTRADSGIKSFTDMLARASAHPGAVTYGTTGPGTAQNIVGAMIEADLHADITPVSYRGSTQILADVIGGQIDLSLDPIAVARPYLESGKLRPLAISAGTRSPQYPAVPTFAEIGIAMPSNAFWFGIAAPRATPQAVVERLERELQAVLLDPSVEAAFQRQSIRVMRGNAEDFRRRVQGEITQYRRIAKDGRVKLE
ncbi:tripartite tricarboxylate transporter substrate binding protein [Cupriavidus sp. CV2]|uniref:Bug family tripartite tricarboxylate transporter substrate binding protein n=1 Tax=Cupriavidus ulmosensis TaxID=3065913 RepID=UPI00296B27B2|nr:tripartite tricarboxylate transporter substrate binding protein [Cupriavidus sp. CV2]MDW3685072.1 tripartite tricarboxylate transporter substrate binding protein [Cupriavidus sp. CV2]